ncbi:GATA zinc finger domain-containing protein 14-like [Metopolophium dirhodum]|uniref:GATA zinc finger domain-containing protein 14-like n=1 Tax=Metopolophium dirhodum TaxID=44670 RepID=UPI00298F7C58|nr:GATA zinc finger domain-containing protein 14-like [Metopolophium dirhodum]
MDLDKAVSMIPICTGKKDVAEFINTCEIALNDIAEIDKQLLLKIITSKLAGNALEVTKYRTLDSWEAIKSILQGAFEHKISERALSIGLNTARMAEGESVAKFANRIEELYYKLCAASTVGLNKAEETVVKSQTKKQAMIIFMTGLPNHLYIVLKARSPKSLEECIQMALDEEIEYNSRMSIENLQNNAESQSFSKNENQGVNGNTKQQNNNGKINTFYRGNNGHMNQNGRNNNFNNRNGYNDGYNKFNKNVNRGGYSNFNSNNRNGYSNRTGYSNSNNRGGYSNNYRQNYNENNNQRNNFGNQNRSNTGCYTCGKTNHIARECWQTNGRPGGNDRANTHNNSRDNGARNSGGGNSSRNNTGVQNLHCSYCNKIGHEISNCFTKQKNEKNNSKNSKGQVPVGVRLVQEIMESPQNDVFTSQLN